ncbi:MAG TPA: hypothetical protein VJY54_03850 [Lachnospiraceae bacterium]|nr:hypothetical protein [Lachnospiraceae bacterium]
MRLLKNECMKVLGSRTTIGILILVCLLNAVSLYLNENKKEYLYQPSQYRVLYEELDGMTNDLAYQELLARQEKETNSYSVNRLLSDVMIEVEANLLYSEYVKNVAESAEVMKKVSLFSEQDDYSNRNIIKTADAYKAIPKIVPRVDPVRGITMATTFIGTDLIAIGFLFFIVFSMITREKELGQLLVTRTTHYGRKQHGICKIGVCLFSTVLITGILWGINLLVAQILYGIGDLNRPIQSVYQFRTCTLAITVGQYLILFFIIKTISLFLITLLSFGAASICRTAIKLYILLFGIMGIEVFLYYTIPQNSYLCLGKYINFIAFLNSNTILTEYLNLNVAGYPIWYLPVYISVAVLGSIILGIWGIRAYSRQSAIPPTASGKPKLTGLFTGKSNSLFLQECYKVFLGGRTFWILATYVLFQLVTYKPTREYFEDNDAVIYKQYMLQLEGMYTEEKQEMLDAKEQYFKKVDEEIRTQLCNHPENSDVLGMKYSEEKKEYTAFLDVLRHADYIKGNGGGFVYDTGYRILTNDEIAGGKNKLLAIMANLLLILCITYVYSIEYQTGMNVLLRSSAKGRGLLNRRKVLLGSLIIFIIYMATYVPFFYSILTVYGTRGIDMPVCSMEHMSGWHISIRSYLIGLSALRYVVMWLEMIIVFQLSARLKSVILTMLSGVCIFVGPLMIMYFL